MNLGIIVSPTFNNYNLLKKVMYKYLILWDISHIITNSTHDNLAKKFAEEHNKENINSSDFWDTSNVVVIFWDGVIEEENNPLELSIQHQKDLLIVNYLYKKVYWYDWGKATRPELGATVANIRNIRALTA